jgi:hypothetical protein
MFLKKLMFLITVIGLCQAAMADQIYDAKHYKNIVAGNNYDGRIYHQDALNRPNAEWSLEATGEVDTYYIRDNKHGGYIVAGDNYDGHLYHQFNKDRSNAKWEKIPAPQGLGWFWLVDKKHSRAIVAGDNYDGHLYHQYPNFRANAAWKFQ